AGGSVVLANTSRDAHEHAVLIALSPVDANIKLVVGGLAGTLLEEVVGVVREAAVVVRSGKEAGHRLADLVHHACRDLVSRERVARVVFAAVRRGDQVSGEGVVNDVQLAIGQVAVSENSADS